MKHTLKIQARIDYSHLTIVPNKPRRLFICINSKEHRPLFPLGLELGEEVLDGRLVDCVGSTSVSVKAAENDPAETPYAGEHPDTAFCGHFLNDTVQQVMCKTHSDSPVLFVMPMKNPMESIMIKFIPTRFTSSNFLHTDKVHIMQNDIKCFDVLSS